MVDSGGTGHTTGIMKMRHLQRSLKTGALLTGTITNIKDRRGLNGSRAWMLGVYDKLPVNSQGGRVTLTKE